MDPSLSSQGSIVLDNQVCDKVQKLCNDAASQAVAVTARQMECGLGVGQVNMFGTHS